MADHRTGRRFAAVVMILLLAGCGGLSVSREAGGTLYDRLGGDEGIDLIVDDALRRMAADPVLKPSFRNVSPFDYPRFKYNFAQQLCELADGPCRYRGKDMRSAHRDLNVTKAQFQRSGLIIQQSLERFDVDRDAQREILRRLGALGPDIIGQ